MQTDKTTLNDLSIFHKDEEQSVFHRLDFTTSVGGKDWLRHLLAHPYSDLAKIQETQQTLQLIIEKENKWPSIITNGTVMVVQKLYDSAISDIPVNPNPVNAFVYRTTN
ncbi:MAG TPA: DNA mismatch repair protein MutS, partial [Segetibacter sp.]